MGTLLYFNDHWESVTKLTEMGWPPCTVMFGSNPSVSEQEAFFHVPRKYIGGPGTYQGMYRYIQGDLGAIPGARHDCLGQ